MAYGDLREVNPGDPITYRLWNALVREVRRHRLLPGVGVRLDVQTMGTRVSVPYQPVVAMGGHAQSVTEYLHPILTSITVGEGEEAESRPAWSVTAGLVNGIEPDTDGGQVGYDSENEGSTDPRDWAAEITGPGWIMARAEWSMDGENVVWEVSVEFHESRPASSEMVGYLPIGKIFSRTESGKTAYTVVPWNSACLMAAVQGGAWVWWGLGGAMALPDDVAAVPEEYEEELE